MNWIKGQNMNRMQKISWMMVICTGIGFILSVSAVVILYFKMGFPRAWAGLAFMGLSGFAGLAPAIFKSEAVDSFHARWGRFGSDGTTQVPPCMGYMLDADENPYGSGPADVLK